MPPVYLDYNATTPVLPEVAEAMQPFLSDFFGNPSSTHWYGIQTRQAIEKARKQTASLLGCEADEIIFTSGGSESNNYAIKGIAFARREQGRHLITSQIEHPAVLEVCEYLKGWDFETTYLPVSAEGIVDPEDLEKAIRPDTILVTIMHANNEVGAIQPLADIAQLTAEKQVIFHSDGAQAAGKIPTPVKELGVDLYSLAGHKLYAPKGVGALYIKRGTTLEKQIHGANHEHNLRAGTENILEIVGLGKACEIARRDMEKTQAHLKSMRDRLVAGLKKEIGNQVQLRINGHPKQALPNTASISFAGIEANTLLSEIEDRIAVSAGAACHSDRVDLSATLQAMNVPVSFAMGTLRFSTGKPTSTEEIDTAVQVVSEALRKLGSTAPLPEFAHPETDQIKLTHYTHGLGCACKLRPQALEQILASLPPVNDEKILVGTQTADDAAVYLLDDERALVQTVDFFTPVVDDPFQFGVIAAANSLSDIYAMGAKPLFALNIVGFPSNRLPLSVLERILEGARSKAEEAGIPIIGGHTVDDSEPKFGLTVCGVVHPDKILKNATAQPGDQLILTKPVGTGILSTALKRGLLQPGEEKQLTALMSALNAPAAAVMQHFRVHACTDVTGFGLLGHMHEMAEGSRVQIRLFSSRVPVLDRTADLVLSGIVPGGTENNLQYLENWINWPAAFPEMQKLILCDAQTSGGLLISVHADDSEPLLTALHKKGVPAAALVGSVTGKGEGRIEVLE